MVIVDSLTTVTALVQSSNGAAIPNAVISWLVLDTTVARVTLGAITAGPAPIWLALGQNHACGIGADNRAWCWGANYSGQTGSGGARRSVTTPEAVVGGHLFRRIAAGWQHTCALTTAGEAYCWGNSNYGVLGDSDSTWGLTKLPVLVSGGHSFVSIAASYYHTCAIDTGGATWCWGTNYSGQLGVGSTAKRISFAPLLVAPPGMSLTGITAGTEHNCALGAGGLPRCWGANGGGQMGRVTTATCYLGDACAPAPAAIGMTNASEIAAGGNSTCAIGLDGLAYCSGVRPYGGDAWLTSPVVAPGAPRLHALVAGEGTTCGTDTGGIVWCWGQVFGAPRRMPFQP